MMAEEAKGNVNVGKGVVTSLEVDVKQQQQWEIFGFH